MDIFFDSPEHLRNLAANFRTMEQLGFVKAYVYDPHCILDREWSKELQRKWNKASAGAIKYVEYVIVRDLDVFLGQWSGRVLAAYLGENSKDLNDFQFQSHDLLILGAEANGIQDKILQYVHTRLVIPSCGRTSSFNVSVSLGIFLFKARNDLGWSS